MIFATFKCLEKICGERESKWGKILVSEQLINLGGGDKSVSCISL